MKPARNDVICPGSYGDLFDIFYLSAASQQQPSQIIEAFHPSTEFFFGHCHLLWYSVQCNLQYETEPFLRPDFVKIGPLSEAAKMVFF